MGWGEAIKTSGLSILDREILRDALALYIDAKARVLRADSPQSVGRVSAARDSARAEDLAREL